MQGISTAGDSKAQDMNGYMTVDCTGPSLPGRPGLAQDVCKSFVRSCPATTPFVGPSPGLCLAVILVVSQTEAKVSLEKGKKRHGLLCSNNQESNMGLKL